MEQIKEEALRLLGDAASATAPGYRIIAKPQVSQRVDTNALKSKHPEVYQSVLKPSVSRPFRVLPA